MKTILIVDDSRFMRTTVGNIVEEIGHRIIGEGSNGNEAVKLYKSKKPDIVFMDITMPEKSGIEALKEIINFDPLAKVIMCSAIGQQIVIKEAMTAGAKNFIIKPFKKENIENVLNLL